LGKFLGPHQKCNFASVSKKPMKYTLVIAAACLANLTHGFVPMVPRNTFLSQIIGVEMLATPEAEGAHESDPTQISVAAEVPQADKGGKAVKPKKSKKVPPIKLTARERTGYVYRDEEGLYDVPLINEAKWYRLSVRKASEKRLTEALNELARSGKWAKIIEEAFYPSSSYVKFKGKNLCLDSKPMVPGLVYVKTQMSPDIADDLEQVHGIYGFSKNNFGIVVPLGQEEAEQIEIMKRRQVQPTRTPTPTPTPTLTLNLITLTLFPNIGNSIGEGALA